MRSTKINFILYYTFSIILLLFPLINTSLELHIYKYANSLWILFYTFFSIIFLIFCLQFQPLILSKKNVVALIFYLVSTCVFATFLYAIHPFGFTICVLIFLLSILQIVDYPHFMSFILKKITYPLVFFSFLYIALLLLTYFYFKSTVILLRAPNASIGIDDILKFDLHAYIYIFILLFITYSYYFIYNKIISSYLISSINIFDKYGIFYVYILTIFITFIMTVGSGRGWLPLAFLHSIFFIFILYFKFPNTVQRVRYITYFYLFIFLAFTVAVMSTCLYKVEYLKRVARAKKLAISISRSQPNKDQIFITEYMDSIAKIMPKKALLCSEDSLLKLHNDFLLKSYNELYDRYEIKKYYYDKSGKNILNTASKNFISIEKSFRKNSLKTNFKNLYKIDLNLPGYFATRVLLDSNKKSIGWVMYEFKLRKIIPNSIFNELYFRKAKEDNYNYAYALYLNDVLYSSSFVDVALLNQFGTIDAEFKADIGQGKVINGKYLYVSKISETEYILISMDAFTFLSFVSNYSFYFTILFFVLSLYILFNTLYYKYKQISTTLSTKIQLFVHLSFFLPLIICSISVFIIINFLYESDMEDVYIENSKKVSNYLYDNLNANFDANPLELQQKVDQVSGILQLDITIFAENGNLVYSTISQLFEKGTLSKNMDKNVYNSIFKQSESTVIAKEKYAGIDFKSVYHPVKSYKDGRLLAIVSVPFYNSSEELSKKIIYVLKTVLNVFCVLFILFLCITFVISRFLTVPLVMLTDRIKKVSLEENNLPLNYQGDDEIGLLVKEYNDMLVKLNESKQLLAINQKEMAWHEMARQVAHEIKNPLTPMKLSLQNMLRRLDANLDKEMIKNTSETVLSQIEKLNEIADSFSTFSKMPVLQMQVLDFKTEIENAIKLYESYENVAFECAFSKDNFTVFADQNLLNRILLNLILNAIESASLKQFSIIKIGLRALNGKIVFSITDNGEGILPIHYSKVFQPNFSTKTSGSGIGLAVVKKGIEQMQGLVWFDSKMGQGTTFYVSLKSYYF